MQDRKKRKRKRDDESYSDANSQQDNQALQASEDDQNTTSEKTRTKEQKLERKRKQYAKNKDTISAQRRNARNNMTPEEKDAFNEKRRNSRKNMTPQERKEYLESRKKSNSRYREKLKRKKAEGDPEITAKAKQDRKEYNDKKRKQYAAMSKEDKDAFLEKKRNSRKKRNNKSKVEQISDSDIDDSDYVQTPEAAFNSAASTAVPTQKKTIKLKFKPLSTYDSNNENPAPTSTTTTTTTLSTALVDDADENSHLYGTSITAPPKKKIKLRFKSSKQNDPPTYDNDYQVDPLCFFDDSDNPNIDTPMATPAGTGCITTAPTSTTTTTTTTLSTALDDIGDNFNNLLPSDSNQNAETLDTLSQTQDQHAPEEYSHLFGILSPLRLDNLTDDNENQNSIPISEEFFNNNYGTTFFDQTNYNNMTAPPPSPVGNVPLQSLELPHNSPENPEAWVETLFNQSSETTPSTSTTTTPDTSVILFDADENYQNLSYGMPMTPYADTENQGSTCTPEQTYSNNYHTTGTTFGRTNYSNMFNDQNKQPSPAPNEQKNG
jgi:hypothetical protein